LFLALQELEAGDVQTTSKRLDEATLGRVHEIGSRSENYFLIQTGVDLFATV